MTDPTPQFPLLIFAEPANAERERLSGGPGRSFTKRPGAAEQGRRLSGKWTALEQAMQNETAALTADLQGIDPELVLVFEIIDDVTDFYRAVQRIDGFEFLAEFDEFDVAGDGVFVVDDDESQTFNGTLFLLASNQVALAEVKNLWDQYLADETAPFPRNLGRWKYVFRLLRDVRRWSAQDRLLGTGALEDFRERQVAGQEVIPAEIELWYRSENEKRADAERAVRNLVADVGGEVVASSDIFDIAYHAMLVHLPIQAIEPLLSDEAQSIELIRADEIAFVRPEAQAAVTLGTVETPEGPFDVLDQVEAAPPLVGVLDGVPLARHELLNERIELDDPDSWEADVPAGKRQHGTAIASLVLHGDRNADGSSLRRPVYFRPVLVPDDDSDRECIPHDQLAIDLVHRAVLRMVGENNDGVSPAVRVVNLSLGDANTQLVASISPWARLLDWLSYRYKILFVVSAGNHPAQLTYEKSTEEFRGMTPRELRTATLGQLIAGAQRRRLLSPAEAMNPLCVGATHDDSSAGWVQDSRLDLLPADGEPSSAYPSPTSALGMGYKRSIKPDLLAPGGRQLFRPMPLGGNPPQLVARPVSSNLSPGLLVATPSSRAGVLDGTRYFHGTSGSAAVVSHYCGVFLEVLEALENMSGRGVDPDYYAVLAKTMLVHTSYLPREAEELRALFGEMSPTRLKDAISRFYGYGVMRPERAMQCATSRATVMGWGELGDEDSDVFDFPLPPCLAGRAAHRRLAITVGYFTPVRNRDRRHRAAELFVSPKPDKLRVARTDADWRTVRRGTLQHEVFSGTRAAAFVDGDTLKVQVNCRSLTGRLSGPVHYGLGVTLEVSAQSELPVYVQVAERIAQQVRARVRGS